MKVAITVWGNRISPVFDAAKTLLIAQIENGRILKKEYSPFDPHAINSMLEIFRNQKITTLICGAISTHPAEIIVDNNIRLISFVMGNAHDFLESFTGKDHIEPAFIMPGCPPDELTGMSLQGLQK